MLVSRNHDTPPPQSASRAIAAATNTPRRCADGPGTLVTFPAGSTLRTRRCSPANAVNSTHTGSHNPRVITASSMCRVSLSGRPVTTVAVASVRLSNRDPSPAWARISRSRIWARC